MWAMLRHIDTAALGTLPRVSAHSASPCAIGKLRMQLASPLAIGGAASRRADPEHPIPPMAACFAAPSLVTLVELAMAFRLRGWVNLAASLDMSRLHSRETVACFGRDPDLARKAALGLVRLQAGARSWRAGAPVARATALNPRAGASPGSALWEPLA